MTNEAGSAAAIGDAARDPLLIEPATRADLPALVAIFAAETMFGQRDSADPVDFPAYERAFDELANDPRMTVYVARRGRQVLGTFQLILMRALTRRGALIAIAEAVQVHPQARGLGIGSAMMEFAIAEAKRRGAVSIQLTSNKKRLDAHRFYDKLGFERRHEGFKIDF